MGALAREFGPNIGVSDPGSTRHCVRTAGKMTASAAEPNCRRCNGLFPARKQRSGAHILINKLFITEEPHANETRGAVLADGATASFL